MTRAFDLLFWLLPFVFILKCAADNAEVTFTLSHDPLNIAEGDTAVFNCSSNNSLVTFTWYLNHTKLASAFISYGVIVNGAGTTASSLIIPGLTDPFNNTEIQCVASGHHISVESPSLVRLRIQGKLAPVNGLMSTQLNGSCYLLNWTPPFTLSGVHILNYNINVTDNNGNIIVQTNVSIAEWEYCPKKFGDLCISIAAVNEVGEGELNEIKLNATKYNIAQTQIHNRSRDENQNWILSINITLDPLTGSDSEKQCIKDILMNCTDSSTSFNTSNITHITDSELMATFNISLERADDKNHTIITHISSCSVLDEYESSKNNSLPISFFDVESFSVSKDSDDVIAFTCKFVPGTQAKGCHIFMNHTITGRNYSVSITKENETGSIRDINEAGDYQIKVYDINQDDIIPSIPAYISNVIVISATLSSFSSELITASLFTSPTMETPSSPVNHNGNTVIIIIVGTSSIIVAIIFVVALSIVFIVTRYHHKKTNKIKAQSRKNSENLENSIKLLKIKQTPQKADLKYIEIEPDPNAPPVPPPLDLERTEYSEIQTRQSDTESFEIYSKLNHNSTNPNNVCIDSKNDTYSSLKHESNQPINNSCSSTPNFDRQISTQTDITEINCEVLLPLTKKELTHKDLSIHVIPYLTEKWREVGLALALTPPQLDDIEENNQGISDVFQLWEDLATRPFTWETLLGVLKSPVINESELANEISCK